MFEFGKRCPNCNNTIIKDWSNYIMNSEQSPEERGMGYETIHYLEVDDLSCSYCGAFINARGYIYEYPVGAIELEEVILDISES